MNNNTILAMDFEHKGVLGTVHSVGIISGSFAPFHMGHMQLVDTARYENNITIVVVSGWEYDRGFEYDMPLKLRYQRLREEFVDLSEFLDYSDVYVAMLDEKCDKPFDDSKGLADYKESILEIIDTYCVRADDCVIRNYVGNKDYVPILTAAYPDWQTILIDREQALYPDLSATKCRLSPNTYWEYIADSFKCFFRKMVVFEGAMSTGKTTLTKKLSAKYNAIGVEEQARFYTEGWRHTIESDLNERDYLAFIEDHLAAMEEALMGKGDYRFVFVDTDAFATLVYLKMNKEKVSPKYKDALETVCGIAIDWCVEHVDKYIVLPNDVPFEMDGSRDGHMEDCRDEFRDMLISELKNRVSEDRIYLLEPNNALDKAYLIDKIVYG